MNRWIVVAAASSLFACSRRASECPEAKQAAAGEIDFAYDEAFTAREQAKLDADIASREPVSLEHGEKNLELALDALERSMGCLAHADCCARLSRLPLPERAAIEASVVDIIRLEDNRPFELEAVLQPLETQLYKDSFLVLSDIDASDAKAWCTSVRDALARVHEDAPAIWKRAIANARERATAATERVATQDQRVASLQTWARALKMGRKLEVPPALSEGSRAKEAVEAVQRYEAACQWH